MEIEQAEGLVSLQIDDICLTVDIDTARKLESDISFQQQYIAEVKKQLQRDNRMDIIWKTSKNQTIHDQEATAFFISLRKKYNEEFMDKKTSKHVIWSKIAEEMNHHNYYVGQGIEGREKCRQKFANLQASYIRYVDKKRQTGEGKVVKPPFYDELHDILGDKHKVNPVLIIDSIENLTTPTNISEPIPSVISDEDDVGPSTSSKSNRFTNVKSAIKPDRNQLLSELIKINKENVELNKRNFKEMMDFMNSESEKRHEEVMALIKSMKKRKRSHSDSD